MLHQFLLANSERWDYWDANADQYDSYNGANSLAIEAQDWHNGQNAMHGRPDLTDDECFDILNDAYAEFTWSDSDY